MKNLLNIRHIFENEKFQKIQDSLALATGLAIITVDYKGIPITKHSSCSDFCKIMRSNSAFSKLCEVCDSRGGIEAARIQSPYIYICHAGLVDFAIPIMSEDNYLGAFLGGQVCLSKQEDEYKLEKIFQNSQKNVSLENTNAISAYRRILTMDLERIRIIADLFFSICRILVDEVKLRSSINELIKNESYIHVDRQFYDTYSEIISDRYYDITTEKKENEPDILKPAFDYIRNNLDGDLSLRNMSKICNISPSYFSRLFAKENLGSYSNYINKLKIDHAKRLLKSTDLSISLIAIKLGFLDCGYFIKVFKKIVDMTPAAFRIAQKNTPDG